MTITIVPRTLIVLAMRIVTAALREVTTPVKEDPLTHDLRCLLRTHTKTSCLRAMNAGGQADTYLTLLNHVATGISVASVWQPLDSCVNTESSNVRIAA